MGRLLLLVLALVAFVSSWATIASAREGELLLELDVPTEFAPRKVCVHVHKLSKQLATARAAPAGASAPGASLPVNLSLPKDGADCLTRPNECQRCGPPPRDTFAVCFEDPNAPRGRSVELLLENVGLRAMKLEGRNLRLSVDYPESSFVTPRVEVLGGDYHAGDVDGVRSGEDLELELVPRCLDRRLRLPPGTNDECLLSSVSSNSGLGLDGGLFRQRLASADSIETLQITETGRDNSVELERCGTTYSAVFDYPPPPEIVLQARVFELRWQRHCLVAADRAPSCPTALLVSHGHECRPVSCSAADTCCYSCSPSRPVEFPTPVRFVMAPAAVTSLPTDGAQASEPLHLDPLVWEEAARFPGDTLKGFVDGPQRRVALDWTSVESESRTWTDPGAEVDLLEIAGPDGRAQRVRRNTASIPAPGLQCHDRFTYRYVGRWPDPPRQDGLRKGKLLLERTLEKQQRVVLGARSHGGVLMNWAVNDRRVASPYGDLGLVALIYRHLEIAATGLVSLYPSIAQFDDAPRQRMSPLARLVLSGGVRLYAVDQLAIVPALGIGLGFPALSSDWSNVHEFAMLALNLKATYEVTRAFGLEISVWTFVPERYVHSYQDIAGPTAVKSRTTASTGFGLGVQWSDLF
jgi:hypothetical protein